MRRGPSLRIRKMSNLPRLLSTIRFFYLQASEARIFNLYENIVISSYSSWLESIYRAANFDLTEQHPYCTAPTEGLFAI
jgi:hypothetical protein